MLIHLVKRNPDLSGTKIRFNDKQTIWFVQTKKNGTPGGSKAQKGDRIYLYETGYAVYAEGTVGEVDKPRRFYSPQEVLDYVMPGGGTHYDNTDYWGRIIIKDVCPMFRDAGTADGKYFCVLEVEAELTVLDQPIPLEPSLLGRSSWRYLKKPIESYQQDLTVHKNIPSSLRLKIFDLCSLDTEAAYYDIDHFVPKSVGGPGNIIENLQPIGSSLNRTKRDKVPSALFSHAMELKILRKLGISRPVSRKPQLLSDAIAKDDARKITSYVNTLPLSKIRAFYREVRLQHRGRGIDRLLS